MKLEEVKRQLGSKQRTIRDLLRFIKTRTDSNPNYTLLLGAGCSISSGVRSATELCNVWRTEILQDRNPALLKETLESQREWLKKNESEWYDSQKEYSTLFEKKYDLQRQRRMFVENEVKNATPSIGYAYLMALVQQEYFNTIFTTNFDDLLNEAFFLYSKQRPIVCAHDSSINSVTVTSKRPKIIKLHGDYLFDDIKATDRETESLGQNMKEKFIEFAKDFGLVVVGYAGGDRSLIDVLTLLLKNEDYFRNGIYWCVRKGSEIPEDLRRLFWKDRVYFVEVDGFDELFAQMYSDYNNGECLPPAASQVNDHYEGVIKRLLAIPNAFPETSEILRKARERLSRQSKRKAIASLLVNPEQSDRPLSNSTYTDDELLILTNLQSLQRERKLQELVELAKAEITKDYSAEIHAKIATFLIHGYMSLRREDEALKIIEQLDKREPFSIRWLMHQARISSNKQEKLKVYERARERNGESAEVHRAIGGWYLEEIPNVFDQTKIEYIEGATRAFTRALQIDPSKRNSAWSSLHMLYQKHELSKPKRNSLLDELEANLEAQGSRDWRILALKCERIDSDSTKSNVANLIDLISEAKKRTSLDDQSYFDRLLLKINQKTKNHSDAEMIAEALMAKNEHPLDAGLAIDLAKYFRKALGHDRKAVKILKENLTVDEFDSNVLSQYISVLIDLKDFDEAEITLNQHQTQILHRYELELRRNIAEGREKYSLALQLLDKAIELGENDSAETRSYILLLDGKYEEAKKVCQRFLEARNYSAEAFVEIINFELARKLTGQKPDNTRLEKVLGFDQSHATRAAIAALRDQKREAIDLMKTALREDKTFRFFIEKWPVFNELRNETSIKEAIDRINASQL